MNSADGGGNLGSGECRICRDGSAAGTLSTACKCTTYVHAECLQKWVSQRADAHFPLLLSSTRETCEVCKAPLRRELLLSWKAGEEGGVCERVVEKADKICMWALSVEGCLLMFLFVLAVLGHALFVMGVYRGADFGEGDVYGFERVGLGVLNAVLTLSLLVLVQKVVSRWLRERDFFLAVASVDCGDLESGRGNEGGRFKGLGQVVLGGVLSGVAAAEIFFLLTVLPMGGGEIVGGGGEG